MQLTGADSLDSLPVVAYPKTQQILFVGVSNVFGIFFLQITKPYFTTKQDLKVAREVKRRGLRAVFQVLEKA